ncbi:MAG: translation initiation factor IF-2 [Planctomycetota bacterium]
MMVRVFELARELGIPSKALLDACQAAGISAKNHMTALAGDDAESLRRKLGGSAAPMSATSVAPVARPGPVPARPESPQVVKLPFRPGAPIPVARRVVLPLRPGGGRPLPPPVPLAPPPAAPKLVEPSPVAPSPGVEPPAAAPAGKPKMSEEALAEKLRALLLSSPPKPKPVTLPPSAKVKPILGPAKAVLGKVPGEKPAAPVDEPPPPDDVGKVIASYEKIIERAKTEKPGRRRVVKERREEKSEAVAPDGGTNIFEVRFPITVKDLSAAIGIRASELIRVLFETKMPLTINDPVPEPALPVIEKAFAIQIVIRRTKDIEDEILVTDTPDRPEDLVPRAPVVTFLGHVDHGKTSLLDRIRKTSVQKGEAGGITQHIGAYRVDTDKSHVVFLDTPGHEAFTAMRARGASVTDVVVLVVAADDGVAPQTIEAINHARAAGVPIVVAINKMDKPGVSANQVKQQLLGHELVWEEWGGKTVCVELSALTGQGVDKLLEMLSLESELLEIKANPKKPARGTVLEASLSGGRGVLATVLVQDGTLRRGDAILAGTAYGRVRAIYNDRGGALKEAGPSMPVVLTGLSGIPEAGDTFQVMGDLSRAKAIAEERFQKIRQKTMVERRHVTLENLYSSIAQGKVKELRLVVKADVQGSLEVLMQALPGLSTPEVKVTILHSGVGGINESDVVLADASDAIIIGFHVVAEDSARVVAQERGVDVRLYQVIYNATKEIKAAQQGMLDPEKKEQVRGHVLVRQIFKVSKVGTVAGCFVKDGSVTRKCQIRVIRDSTVIYTGAIATLRRFKDDVTEVKEGLECGIRIEKFDDLKEGDVFEAFEVVEVERKVGEAANS